MGVWIFGALGGLATTTIVGARAIARGLAQPQGLLTESPLAAGTPLVPLAGLVFGGHEIRAGTVQAAAREIHDQNGTLPGSFVKALHRDLAAVTTDIRPGCLANAGRTIRALADLDLPRERLRAQIERLASDIDGFRRRHRLARVVCVNLTSTEPPLRETATHATLARFERALDRDQQSAVRPTALYAYVAAHLGLPLINFTPANALLPAIRTLFEHRRVPYMGSDGKTGETLVKSALAPMFKYRNLRVLSWQGYNMLGDRDGVVLAHADNKRAKVATKDALLPAILGYPLHTHVAIDYVPSLHDLKTAWDFIHFEGFLGVKMAMQFTWQGCDAILAAPIVLDLIRFADLAQRRGEFGPMKHLACFFKRPLEVAEHDLHLQWHLLTEYLDTTREGRNRGKAPEPRLRAKPNPRSDGV